MMRRSFQLSGSYDLVFFGDEFRIQAADKIVQSKGGQSTSPVLMGYGELSSPPPKETENNLTAPTVTFNMTPTTISGPSSANSTPTSKRSIKRRTMLFSSKSEKKEITDTADVGSGRSIPLKQGFLYKRCTNSLNKEWKKKYATLLEKGMMIYYPSLNGYMEDAHGKIISLKHTTVKIPGKRPPKATSSQVSSQTDSVIESNGLPENNNLSSNSSSNDLINDSNQDALNATVISNSANPDLTDNNIISSVWTPFPTVIPPPSPPPSGTLFRPDAKEKREKRNKRNKNTKSCEIEYLPDELEKAISSASVNIGTSTSSRLDGLLSSAQKKSKNHRRIKSHGGSKPLAVETDSECEECEFTIVSLDGKSWHFEAPSTEERDRWVSAIEQRILNSLQSNESGRDKARASVHTDPKIDVKTIRDAPGNDTCIDCTAPNPGWASLNLGSVMCIECSGVHRNLGTHLSRVRSLDLDDWPHELIAVMSAVGNNLANSVWEAECEGKIKPSPTSTREEKEKWIRAKYEGKEFLCGLPKSQLSLGMQLIEAVKSENIKSVISLLAQSNASEVNTSQEEDGQTALHISCSLGNVVITLLLIWYNADVMLTDMKGHTALWYAQMTGSSLCSDVLINNGCKVTEINNVKTNLSFS